MKPSPDIKQDMVEEKIKKLSDYVCYLVDGRLHPNDFLPEIKELVAATEQRIMEELREKIIKAFAGEAFNGDEVLLFNRVLNLFPSKEQKKA